MYPIARPLSGTRFRLFPQSPETGLFSEPETVIIGLPPGSIGPGPCDDRMYVADAIGKHVPYGEGIWPSTPPWPGPVRPPVAPGPDGNFDHIPVESPDFLPVHMYGVVRLVLEIWESYLGGPVYWIEGSEWPRLELVPVVDWDNAHFGPGYMEAGIRRDKWGVPQLFCLNFDVLAHEMAHAILFSVVGFPSRSSVTAEYLGFQEGCADFMALLSALHFMSVIDLTLDETGGNLYVLNTLSRIGETSATDQIRIASNDFKLSDFTGVPTRRTAAGSIRLARSAMPTNCRSPSAALCSTFWSSSSRTALSGAASSRRTTMSGAGAVRRSRAITIAW
jgi:hypothetical protein